MIIAALERFQKDAIGGRHESSSETVLEIRKLCSDDRSRWFWYWFLSNRLHLSFFFFNDRHNYWTNQITLHRLSFFCLLYSISIKLILPINYMLHLFKNKILIKIRAWLMKTTYFICRWLNYCFKHVHKSWCYSYAEIVGPWLKMTRYLFLLNQWIACMTWSLYGGSKEYPQKNMAKVENFWMCKYLAVDKLVVVVSVIVRVIKIFLKRKKVGELMSTQIYYI